MAFTHCRESYPLRFLNANHRSPSIDAAMPCQYAAMLCQYAAMLCLWFPFKNAVML